MAPKKAMELFGEALRAYAYGDKSRFYFRDMKGNLHEHKLNRYFRKHTRLSKLEKRLTSLSRGNILDVGCGTGNYITALSEKGNVQGIDISKNVIDVARMKGCDNCFVADIFKFHSKNKFDTITFLENNMGMGGSVNKTRQLLKILSRLLKDGGQILAISAKLNNSLKNTKYFYRELKTCMEKTGWCKIWLD